MQALFIGGTGSDSGKSMLVTGLLAWAKANGISACPFKAQNMSLNSYVCESGEEISISQSIQAKAAGITADARMNPILLKPYGNFESDVIVMGKSLGRMAYNDFIAQKPKLQKLAWKAFDELQQEYDWVIIEGAGSVAEINLWNTDLVNLSMAEYANAEVWLICDIERGGAFASIHGTLDLLPKPWRKLIVGYILNKFQGNAELLTNGIQKIKDLDNIPCLGALPKIPELKLPAEDSLSFSICNRQGVDGCIGVIMYPSASLLTDLEPLWEYSEFGFQLIHKPDEIAYCDALILPGSKNSLKDMEWLEQNSFVSVIANFKGVVYGICGGLQIMGETLEDADNLEGSNISKIKGLGLLKLKTQLRAEKITKSTRCQEPFYGSTVKGFEIHKGRSQPQKLFYSNQNFRGSYLHGVFENDFFRNSFLSEIYFYKNSIKKNYAHKHNLNATFDLLAKTLSQHLESTLNNRVVPVH